MNRLRDLREEAGLKQKDVAQALAMTNTSISMYELEQRQLTPELIIKFCSFYHCSSDYLLGISDIRTPAATAAAEAAPDLRAMAEIIAGFTPEQTALFLKLVELMKQNEK